jgi:hypothetical protein
MFLISQFLWCLINFLISVVIILAMFQILFLKSEIQALYYWEKMQPLFICFVSHIRLEVAQVVVCINNLVVISSLDTGSNKNATYH